MNVATKKFNGKTYEISLNGKVITKASKKSFNFMVICFDLRTNTFGCISYSSSEKSANTTKNWWAKNQAGLCEQHQVIEIKEA